MSVYFVTGKLGSGKSLCSVGRIKDYLEQGRKVATNLDLDLSRLTNPHSEQSVIRVPDYPRLCDLEAIGRGIDDSSRQTDENCFGLLVLDELAMQFNNRNWREKDRLELITWFRHARKLSWDIIFIAQDIESVDGQLVNALCEHLVICRRLDRMTVPIIGPLLRFMGFEKVLPKLHIATVYYSQSENAAFKVGRWVYRSKDLYKAYDTKQIFTDQQEIYNGQVVDMRAVYTILSASYITGHRYINQLQNKIQNIHERINTISGKPSKTKIKNNNNKTKLPDKYIELIKQAAPLIIMLLVSIGYYKYNHTETGKTEESGGIISSLIGHSSLAMPKPKTEISNNVSQNVTQIQPVPNPPIQTTKSEMPYDKILSSCNPHISSIMLIDKKISSLSITCVDQSAQIERYITKDDLIMAGYQIILSNLGIEILSPYTHYSIPFARRSTRQRQLQTVQASQQINIPSSPP